MNKNISNSVVSGDQKTAVTAQKPVTPGVQGVGSSHGVKLSANMTSDDRKKLLTQLEEWRKLKREKIAAAMLAKQKQGDRPKLSLLPLPLKSKPVPQKSAGGQERQSVFERLYRNEKIKKPEAQNFKENSSEITKPNPHRVNDQIKITETKSAPQPISNQIKIAETKPVIHIINNDIENDENRLPADSSCDQAEFVERELTPHISHDENEETDIKSASQEHIDEVKITETRPPAEVINDQNKDVMIKPALHSLGEQRKSTIIKPVPHRKGSEVKTTESKPVKSGLDKSLPVKGVEFGKLKVPLRRSLSMMFHQKRKEQNNLRRSISTQNIPKLGPKPLKINDSKALQMVPPRPRFSEVPTKNKGPVKPVTFVTPKSTKPLTSTHLRNKLEDWLKINGHPLEGYRHLRCFGIHDNEIPALVTPVKTVDEPSQNANCESSPSTPLDDSNKENVTPPTVIRQVSVKDAENWLKELHRLIVELKYPAERCEEWLAAIRRKCASCTQVPIYWECLAALDESKGDIKSAIADYETAIIKGGEVETVGDSLAQLFDKMVIESEKRSKPKLEKGLDPKNIFKSTIIKFALQQKALKNLSSELDPGVRKQLYVATPVRRSTRIQTPSKSTDEVTSLQTLTPELRKNVTFKPNESLLLD